MGLVAVHVSSDPFLDEFNGDLSGWTRFNGGTLRAASVVSGRMHHSVLTGDNTGNDTAWFDDGTLYVGQSYYRNMSRPSSGNVTYCYFVGIGIGSTGSPTTTLTADGHNYSFMAAQAIETLATDDTVAFEQVAPGLRLNGSVLQTIEPKTKLGGGNSSQNDLGALGATHFNLRLTIPNTGNVSWHYQANGSDPAVDSWTSITMPGTQVTFSSTFAVGFTAYSFDSTIGSTEQFTGVIDRTYSETVAV